MLFSDILTNKLPERNKSFYVYSRYVRKKQSLIHSGNPPFNLSILKIYSSTNNYDSVNKRKAKRLRNWGELTTKRRQKFSAIMLPI